LTAFVLDPSVAAKWLLKGPDEMLQDEALLVLSRFRKGELRLAVPDIFWPELGNILWKAVRRGRISLPSAEELIETIVEFDFPTLDCQPLLCSAFLIAAKFDRTAYDSLYLAAARHLGIPLLTADERLVNALGARFPVRWLGAI
jgi:predicted nucleic acid-binding protein